MEPSTNSSTSLRGSGINSGLPDRLQIGDQSLLAVLEKLLELLIGPGRPRPLAASTAASRPRRRYLS
jgi:hypothetical protein